MNFLAASLVVINLTFLYALPTTEYQKGIYNEKQTFRVSKYKEYIISYPPVIRKNPYRITAKASKVDVNFPVLLVVRQEKQVLSWQIPMVIKLNEGTLTFSNTSRTLCYTPDDYISTLFRNQVEKVREFSISLTTANREEVDVTIIAEEVFDYYIKDETNYTVTVSPSEPAFFYYSFKKNTNKTSVFVAIDSLDDTCLTVSVQNSLCPVRDLNNNIAYEGKFQVMDRKGGMMIKKSEFQNGFFLVFVSKIDNYHCSSDSMIIPGPKERLKSKGLSRMSTLHFKVTQGPTKSQLKKAVLIIFGSYIAFCIVVLGVVAAFYWFGKLKKIDQVDASVDQETEHPQPFSRQLFQKRKLMLVDMAYNQKESETKSFNYLWHIMNIGLFYGIPVVQLMISYQRLVYVSGDLDTCYHNLYCAHPLGGSTDFNHIYSNIGYVMVGILFIIITALRQKFIIQNPLRGVPKHYGLFYAMGIALIIEGVLSACYHICPNQSNYQFDTSFMYVMAVLCMMKLFQNRHPNINASAYSTFAVVGFAVFIAMFGILSNSVGIIIIFLICYIMLCVYLSFEIYFFGEVIQGCQFIMSQFKEENRLWKKVKPVRKGHFILLLITNICNYAMAGVGVYLYPSKTNFGTYLLAILMGNTVLHTTFYICMKLYHKEKVCWEATIYGLLGLASWMASSYFFFNNSTQWEVTPAESKQLNNDCIFLDFYDQHDVWHMLSAPALFFSFMLLMCIDDDLADTPQEQIEIF